MRNKKVFQFKHFSIHHELATMKVGTDGVLIGAWADVRHAKSVLDIGTGTGLIALMIAQRTTPHVLIDAVEISEPDFEQACDNVRRSPWHDRIRVHHTPIQKFPQEKKYDLIISNPPYFVNSQLPPIARRQVSRHVNTLSHEELLTQSINRLTTKGRLVVILPPFEGHLFAQGCEEKTLILNRICHFRARAEKPVERHLMEFSFKTGFMGQEELNLYKDKEVWSDEYCALTRDFYLKL